MTLAESLRPAHTALLVVDVQNDFVHQAGALARLGADVSAAQSIVPRLNQLVEQARQTGVLVVWLTLVNADYTTSEVAHEHRERTRPGTDLICRRGEWGAELYGVRPLAGEPVIEKHRYSGFVDTDLWLILRSRGIQTVVLTGVATNVCVESTARDAFMRDYRVVLVENCSAAYSAARHQASCSNIADHFGYLVDADEVFAAWSAVEQSA